jgi:hypothetical protein
MGIAIYYFKRKESGPAITKYCPKRRLLNAHDVVKYRLLDWLPGRL